MTLFLARQVDTTSVILLVVAFGVLTLIGGLGIMLFRRKLLKNEDDAGEETLFESLRRMRDSGQMSIAEYEAAKKAIVKKAAERMDKPVPDTEKKTAKRG